MYANRLALSDGAESVRIAVASAVSEFAAGARARFIVILLEGASARAGVQRKIAHILKMRQFERSKEQLFTYIHIGNSLLSILKLQLTLPVESPAESLALFFGLESIGISAATAVNERLTRLMLRIVIIRSDGIVATASLDWRQANRAL